MQCVALVGPGVASAVALLAVAGWVTGDLRLTGGTASYVPTAPVTALAMLLLAVSLLGRLAARRRPLRDLTAVLGGIALAGGCALTIAYLVGSPLLYAAAVVPVALPTSLDVVALAGGLDVDHEARRPR